MPVGVKILHFIITSIIIISVMYIKVAEFTALFSIWPTQSDSSAVSDKTGFSCSCNVNFIVHISVKICACGLVKSAMMDGLWLVMILRQL